MPIRSLSDLTWKDAIVIELDSIKGRVEADLPVPEIQTLRLSAMIKDHWNPMATAPKKG